MEETDQLKTSLITNTVSLLIKKNSVMLDFLFLDKI